MELKVRQATTVEGFGEVMGIAASGEKPNFKPRPTTPGR